MARRAVFPSIDNGYYVLLFRSHAYLTLGKDLTVL